MIYVHGIGHFHPENIISNSFLEDLDIGTDNQWIMERVGIENRRTVLPLDYIRQTKNRNPQEALEAAIYKNVQTAGYASSKALERAKINKADIGMIISGSCTPDNICPSEACTIASWLEIECPAFDINSACSTIAAQLNFLNKMKAEELPDYILLVTPENNTRFVDYSDRSSSVLWGDCSTALVISTRIPSKLVIKNTTFTSSPSGCNKVQFPVMKHFTQEGRTVQTFAIKKTLGLINEFKSRMNEEDFHRSFFIGHQANRLMLESICHLSGIKKDRHFFNVNKFGNCGAAGAVSVLSMNQDKLNPGDLLMIGIVGAGLSWGGMVIEVK